MPSSLPHNHLLFKPFVLFNLCIALRHGFYTNPPQAFSMANEPGYVVVIGASAGGFTALIELVSQLNPESDAAYFVVLHISGTSISGFLAHKLQGHTKLKTVLAMDGLPIQRGYIYVAVPNHHLVMTDKEVRLGHGPSENRWRPSIDVLFRAAASHFTNRVIGVVLTGLMNDGTTGMSSIQRSGGITIVQDPNEAEYPDMPFSVINAMEVDHVVSLADMGKLLEELTKMRPEKKEEAPRDVIIETEISEKSTTDIATAAQLGKSTVYTCPDCGGVLFEHGDDAIMKLKCHTGHSFTVRDLILRMSEETESSLWYAIRSLEQRHNLFQTLTDRYRRTGNHHMANDYQNRVIELRRHIENLKNIIVSNLNQPDDV
jgi:two-component system, chemotaxis family, protein-glutamate methylesterase/glutaminase